MQALATPLIEIKPIGDEIGRASALKMAYASLTKGTNALRTAALLAGEQLGVSDALHAELQYSQAEAYREMGRITISCRRCRTLGRRDAGNRRNLS